MLSILKIIQKMSTLIFGLFLYALAIVLTIHSQLGASPWDVFHLGLVNHTSLTLGQASQLVGLVLVIISTFLGEIPGIGTVLNTYLIGLFIDLLQTYQLIPIASGFIQQYFMLFLGIYLIGWATYFYMGAELGSGPRDSVMMALIRKTKQPVWKIRGSIETSALVIGYFMGGLVGIGTILIAGLIGVSIEHVYKIRKRDPAKIVHITFIDHYQFLKKLLQKQYQEENPLKQNE